jgi:DNA-directed RNA polymerase specialized sigma subunit
MGFDDEPIFGRRTRVKQHNQMVKRPKLHKYLDDDVLEHVQHVYRSFYRPQTKPRAEVNIDAMMSFEDIGAELGVTKQRAQQIVQQALKKFHYRLMKQYPGITLDDFLSQER